MVKIMKISELGKYHLKIGDIINPMLIVVIESSQ